MDTTRFDAVARNFAHGTTRRDALHSVMTGAAAITVGGSFLVDGR